MRGLLTNWARKLDFLAPDVTMNVNKNGGVQTLFGSFVWIIAAGCFTASTVITLRAFFSTDSPNVSSETSSSTTYPTLDLSQNYLFPIFLPFLSGTMLIPFEEVSKFVTVRAFQTRYTLVPLPDGSFTFDVLVSQFEIKRCSEMANSSKINWQLINDTTGPYAKSIYDDGLCPDYPEGNSSVQGRGSDEIFVSIEFSIFPCTLSNTSQCKTTADLSRFSFIYFTGQETLSLGNYEQPLSYSFNGDEFYYIDLGLTNRLGHKVMVAEIWDAAGFLQPDSLRISYPKIEQSFLQFTTRDPTQTTCTKEQIAAIQCFPYFSRNFQSGGTLNKITRTYKGVVETMGDIGGARDTIFMIAMLLYGWYNERCKRKLLLDSVLSLRLNPDVTGLSKTEKKIISTVEEKLYEGIQETLDLVSIAKNANRLEMLVELMLTKQQVDSAPHYRLGRCAESVEGPEEHPWSKHDLPISSQKQKILKNTQASNRISLQVMKLTPTEEEFPDKILPTEEDFQGPPKQVRNSVDPQPRDPNDWPSSEEGLIQRLQAEFDTIISKCLEENQDMIKRLTNPDTSNSGAPGDPRVGTTLSNPKPAPFHPLEVGSPQ